MLTLLCRSVCLVILRGMHAMLDGEKEESKSLVPHARHARVRARIVPKIVRFFCHPLELVLHFKLLRLANGGRLYYRLSRAPERIARIARKNKRTDTGTRSAEFISPASRVVPRVTSGRAAKAQLMPYVCVCICATHGAIR